MNKRRIPMKGGGEYDALSKSARKFYHWNPGQLKAIKQGFNRRERRSTRRDLRKDRDA